MSTIAFVVVALAGAAIVVAAPQFRKPICVVSCEQSARGTLRCIAYAEHQFRASGLIDMDRDGVGEFGAFGELSGARALPAGSAPTAWPVVSGVFRTVD